MAPTAESGDASTHGFPIGSVIYGCSDAARLKIIEAKYRIQGQVAFQKFWERVLTPIERDALGGDMSSCFQQKLAPYFLVELRDYNLEKSIIEIAYRIGFLLPQTYWWLLAEIGESPSVDSEIIPCWNRELGQLEYRSKVVRTLCVSKAKNVVEVFDEFQSRRWPKNIENPVQSTDPLKIHEVVQSLNDNLSFLRFRAANQRIYWSRTTS